MRPQCGHDLEPNGASLQHSGHVILLSSLIQLKVGLLERLTIGEDRLVGQVYARTKHP